MVRLSRVFCVSIHILNYLFSSVKNATGILIGITLNQVGCLGSMVILTISIPPIQEHNVSFYLFVSFSVPFISVCWFSKYKSFTS